MYFSESTKGWQLVYEYGMCSLYQYYVQTNLFEVSLGYLQWMWLMKTELSNENPWRNGTLSKPKNFFSFTNSASTNKHVLLSSRVWWTGASVSNIGIRNYVLKIHSKMDQPKPTSPPSHSQTDLRFSIQKLFTHTNVCWTNATTEKAIGVIKF